jgi:hypothetical protein
MDYESFQGIPGKSSTGTLLCYECKGESVYHPETTGTVRCRESIVCFQEMIDQITKFAYFTFCVTKIRNNEHIARQIYRSE